eukprot:TRINITY_DN10396_c0_g1_i1.p1 TRINITY_DN10396_c0_g1~~TRINITY_DN10396_c0_g1_i1.p1  ORF type:complete len:293 (-),score=43.29 TRINITY_DN10396_c0_g1_i1:54-932(-)
MASAALFLNDPKVSAWWLRWNSSMMTALVCSLIAGFSTMLGALFVLLLPSRPEPWHMAFALALAAGVMMAVSFLEIGMSQFHRGTHWFECSLAAGVGVVGSLVLGRCLPEIEEVHPKAGELEESITEESALDNLLPPTATPRRRGWRLAFVLFFALTLHNFPEGLAVAASSVHSFRLGLVVTVAIAAHNVPEGIAIALAVLDATGSQFRAVQMATLSGLAEPLGAFVAVVFLPEWFLTGRGLNMLMCFVGGIMASVSLSELLPAAVAHQCYASTGMGFLSGVAVMLVTHAVV